MESEMPLAFSTVYFQLSKKEKIAVLYAAKSYSKYPDIHLGQILFLHMSVVKSSMAALLTYAIKCEIGKVKPKISSKICQAVMKKLIVTHVTKLVQLDELKVKNKIRQFRKSNLYITYLPIFQGRVSCRIELKSRERNMFFVTTKEAHLNEAIEQLTYKYGLHN